MMIEEMTLTVFTFSFTIVFWTIVFFSNFFIDRYNFLQDYHVLFVATIIGVLSAIIITFIY